MKRPLQTGLLAALPFFLLILLWHIVTVLGWYSPKLLVPPLQVWRALLDLLQSDELQMHLGISLQRLSIGLVLGSIGGILCGAWMAASRSFDLIVRPTFNVVRQVPSVALIPIFIMIFGIGETFKLLIIIKASFFVMAVAAYESVKGVSAQYLDVARAYRLPRHVMFFRILLPATAPDMLTGFRLAVGRSWGSLVVAELLAAEIGLGQMMEFARQMFRMDVVMVGMVITGLIGFSLDRSVKFVERRVTPWRPA